MSLKTRKADLTEGIFFIAVAAGALILAFRYHTPENFRLSPALFPIVTALVLIGLALVLAFRCVRRERQETATGQHAAAHANTLNVCLVFLLCLLYTAVMDKAGFILATFVYLLAFLLLLGERRAVVVILVPVLTVGMVWLFFSKALSVPLP